MAENSTVGTANLQSLFPSLSVNFPQRAPVDWTNNETQLSAANLNTLTTNIVYNRNALGTIISTVNDALTTISNRNAGWKALDSGGSYTLGEIFNDYEKNRAIAPFSHAEGEGTYAYDASQHVQGRWNELPEYDADTKLLNPYAHIIGGGTSESDRKNIHTVDWDGNAWYKGDVSANIERGSGLEPVSFTTVYEAIAKLIAKDGELMGTEEDSKSTETSLCGIRKDLNDKYEFLLSNYLTKSPDTGIKTLGDVLEWLNNEQEGAITKLSSLTSRVASLETNVRELLDESHAIFHGEGSPDMNAGQDGDIYIQIDTEE
jgi:hypothetical protein